MNKLRKKESNQSSFISSTQAEKPPTEKTVIETYGWRRCTAQRKQINDSLVERRMISFSFSFSSLNMVLFRCGGSFNHRRLLLLRVTPEVAPLFHLFLEGQMWCLKFLWCARVAVPRGETQGHTDELVIITPAGWERGFLKAEASDVTRRMNLLYLLWSPTDR